MRDLAKAPSYAISYEDAVSRQMAAWTAATKRSRLVNTLLAVGLLAVCGLLPLISQGTYNFARYGVALAYVMAAVGLNLAIGFTGELVLGHAVVMAVGAYSAGMLSAHADFPFALAVLGGVAGGVLAGAIIMLPGLRVRGWYLALITMFAVLVLPRVVVLTEVWTGGEFGLTGIKHPAVLGYSLPDWVIYEVTLLSLALVSLLIANLVRSGWGYRLRAVRDIGVAAAAVGIRPGRVRFTVYLLASVPAALAGALQAFTDGFVNADSFGMSLTLLLLTGVMLGGAGTLWGPFVGMAPLIALSFWIGPFSVFNAIALGAGLLISAVAVPDGFVPLILRWFVRLTHRSAADLRPHVDLAVTRPDDPSTRPPRQFGPEILTARGITKSFGGVHALQGIDISVRRGELIGLIGPNGSGKSTFLNVLSGFLAPDAGTISFRGEDVTAWRVDELARAGIGRTFQVPQLIDQLTTIENIEIGLVGREKGGLAAALLRLPVDLKRSRLRREAALATFRAMRFVPESLGRPVAELSLGFKRIVEIGRAAVSAPTILLLDEPAAGLNDSERQDLGDRLKEIAARGITILVVEHNVPFVLRVCDSLLLLENGQVTCRADLKERLPANLEAYLRHDPTPTPVRAAS